jgi:predicted Co/Zn/Cd cation transporter (cation efflux family)
VENSSGAGSLTKENSITTEQATLIETRSLNIGKWANLFMGVAGVLAAWLSRSDALLVDGLYSAVNFFSAIVAARVGLSIQRRPDKLRPFGYESDEALYVTFRSMVLVGIMVFALMTSGEKIFVYATGGTVPSLVFGPIVIYFGLMIVICTALAVLHHRSWVKTGKRSEMLRTERTAAIADGVISAGAGIGLMCVPLLAGTALEVIIPIADAIIVIILVLCIAGQPIRNFLGALGEISGQGADESTTAELQDLLKEAGASLKFETVDLAVSKLGRWHTVVGYIHPKKAMAASDVDALNADFQVLCESKLGECRTEIVLTQTPRLQTG